MKKLIITAHPSTKGFTHRIAEAYQKSSEEAGHEAEILDLYKTDLKQDFLVFEDQKNIPPDPIRGKICAKILEAGELVFIFPMWWTCEPAVMKNFIDQNFSAGFAFEYRNGRPVGLLKGRTARVFMTCDGPGFYYRILLSPFKTIWKTMRLGVCGIKVKSFILFGRMRKRNEEEKNVWLEKVKILAKE